MKVRSVLGLLIMILGVLAIVYAAYLLVLDLPGGSIPRVVGYDSVIALAGAVAFITGVVIQGFRRSIALVVHLAALIPYYLAVARVQSLGQGNIGDPNVYLMETQLYWAAGLLLNIIGIILNRIGRKKVMPPQPAGQPPMPAKK